MRAVNLLPREQARRRTVVPAGPVLVALPVAVVASGLVAGAFMLQRARVADRQKDLDAVRAQLEATPPPVPEEPGNAELVKEKNARITALSEALSKRMAFDRLLRELSRVLPGDVWLSSMVATAPGATPADASAPPASTGTPAPSGTPSPTPATGTEGLVLTGYTYSQEGVARLLARLAVVPYVKGVRLQRSALTEISNRRIVEFSIVANLRSPEELG